MCRGWADGLAHKRGVLDCHPVKFDEEISPRHISHIITNAPCGEAVLIKLARASQPLVI